MPSGVIIMCCMSGCRSSESVLSSLVGMCSRPVVLCSLNVHRSL